MKSIRIQLLIWLLPSFILIAIIASSSLYFSEKLRLESSLDSELSKLARAVKLSHNMPRNRFGGPAGGRRSIAERTKFLLKDENGEFYLQVWDEFGNIVSKSQNLGKEQLSSSNELNQLLENSHKLTHYDSTLGFEGDIRVYSFVMRGGLRSSELYAVVAVNKTAVNKQLKHFAVQLIVGSALCCLLLSAILIFVIRKTLIPIHNLSEELVKVEAGSLHNRLSTSSVPTEINPFIERLNQLLKRLERSFDKERQFNNDLAHELRTPLAAIRTTSEVALKWPEQSSIDDHQYIAESSAQLQNTIDSLLSLARIESSGKELTSEKLNVATIVDECLALHSTQIKERGLSITPFFNEQCVIKSDPHLIRIIISNLVSNAVEYAPENSEVLINNNNTLLTVANLAPNINENDLDTMFDRLWRKDDSRTGTKHVGLGLSIANTAAQALSFELIASLCKQNMLHLSLLKQEK